MSNNIKDLKTIISAAFYILQFVCGFSYKTKSILPLVESATIEYHFALILFIWACGSVVLKALYCKQGRLRVRDPMR
jgi:hypothetical protein